LHIAQQMPLPLTISCSRKSRFVLPLLVLPFWYLLTQVVPDKFQKSSKTVVCVCVTYYPCHLTGRMFSSAICLSVCLLARHTILAFHTSVCLSVHPSVTLVDSDHIVQQKLKIGKTGWVRLLATCVTKPTRICDTRFCRGRPERYGKLWWHASNGLHFALSLLAKLLILVRLLEV